MMALCSIMKAENYRTLWNQEIRREWKSLKLWYNEVENICSIVFQIMNMYNLIGIYIQ